METAGEILRKKRRKKNLTLDQVERAVKIKKQFLEFLEENNFTKFPSEIYARGFIKNYAEFLGVPPEKILAVFRRQFREKTPPLFFKKLSQQSFFKITPQRIKWGLVLILLILFSGYLLKQYQSLTQGPSLVISEPEKNVIVYQDKIIIKGKTDPEVKVFINNEEIYPNEKGEFAQEISLSEGVNQVVIFAENNAGKRKTLLKEITFERL